MASTANKMVRVVVKIVVKPTVAAARASTASLAPRVGPVPAGGQVRRMSSMPFRAATRRTEPAKRVERMTDSLPELKAMLKVRESMGLAGVAPAVRSSTTRGAVRSQQQPAGRR